MVRSNISRWFFCEETQILRLMRKIMNMEIAIIIKVVNLG